MGATQELVCVVDDDQSVRRSLRRLFKSAGYAAEMFASAEDYLARENFSGPICLVLDVRMPGLNGLGLQEELESRGGCEQIIFITGHEQFLAAVHDALAQAGQFVGRPPRRTPILKRRLTQTAYNSTSRYDKDQGPIDDQA